MPGGPYIDDDYVEPLTDKERKELMEWYNLPPLYKWLSTIGMWAIIIGGGMLLAQIITHLHIEWR